MKNNNKYYLYCPHTSNHSFKALATAVHCKAEIGFTASMNSLAGKRIKIGSAVGLLCTVSLRLAGKVKMYRHRPIALACNLIYIKTYQYGLCDQPAI
jgi:hypothetical protein